MSRRRGVALVLVLWLIVVVGGIALEVTRATRASTALASNARARTIARFAAESGIEAVRTEIDGTLEALVDTVARARFLNGLEERRQDSVVLGDGRFSVAIVDPSRRLDVNAAPARNLAILFERFTDPVRAEGMARAIRQRIERGQRSSAADAATVMGPGLTPRTVFPLRSLEELTTLPGADLQLLQRVAPHLTVDGDGTINRRMASDTVRAAAFGETRDMPSRLLLLARGWSYNHALTHEIQAVFAVASDRLVLVSWRERLL